MLEFIVLGLLCGQPLTGYDLKNRIENGPGVFNKVSFGSLYPLLGRLCAKGYATVDAVAVGGRAKKYYAATAEGEKHFTAWLCQPVDVRKADSQRLAKIYFFDRLPAEQRAARLAEYREAVSGYLAELNTRREQLLVRGDVKEHYFKLSTLYYGICVLQETLCWCDCLAAGQPLESLLLPACGEVSVC